MSTEIKLIVGFAAVLIALMYLAYSSHKKYMKEKDITQLEVGSLWGAIKFILAVFIVGYLISLLF